MFETVYPCKIPHYVNRCLILQNFQLVFELATRGNFQAVLLLFDPLLLFQDMERVHSGGQRNRWMQVRCGGV
jgi:hypothetical protein